MTGMLLSIDLWHTTIAAALRSRDGRVVAVAVDGEAVSSSGVAVGADGTLQVGRDGVEAAVSHSYVKVPAQRLFETRTRVGPVDVDPVDLLTASLSSVVREIRSMVGVVPNDVVISVPAGWTPRQRQGLLAAATRAGLGTPTLTTGAESIVREQMARGVPVPAGSVVLVVRLDTTVGELTLLRYDGDRFEVVARPDLGELGNAAGVTLSQQAASALTEALHGGDVRVDQIAIVFAQVPTGAMPELASALASAGVRAQPMRVADVAAAFGAARPGPARTVKGHAGRTRGGVGRSLIAWIVAWAGAGVLAYQMFGSAMTYPLPAGAGTWLQTEMHAWALVPVFVTLGAASAALMFAHGRRTAPMTADPSLGSALIAAATVGVGAAVALAMFAAAEFATSPTPLLRWTLLSTLPLALVLTGLGLVVARFGPPPDSGGRPQPWRDRLTFPMWAQVLAVASSVCIVASLVGLPPVDSSLWWRMLHVGGYGLGWALVFLLPINPYRRVIVGFLFAVASAAAVGIHTVGFVSSCLVAAITLWWLWRLVPAAARLSRPKLGAS